MGTMPAIGALGLRTVIRLAIGALERLTATLPAIGAFKLVMMPMRSWRPTLF